MKYLEELQTIESCSHMNNYRRQPLVIERGAGAFVWDTDGRRYLDFLAGIAVNSVGHCHPKVVEAIQKQAETLIHVSNLYYTLPQFRLLDKLTDIAKMDRVLLCNSGAEANECAMKVARKWGHNISPSKAGFICLQGGFHGRTFGSLSITAQKKYQHPFEPLVPGVKVVHPGDIAELRAAIDGTTCGVILETMQGESGVHPIDKEYLAECRKLCDKYSALLIIDEVQTGMGRTGSWFASQHYQIRPDIITAAKALGGGLPIGACMVTERADCFEPGDHGTTFGGGPVVCAAALAVISVIEEERLLDNATELGGYMKEAIGNWGGLVSQVRGLGLMIGFDITEPVARDLVAVCRENGLIINATGDSTIRLVPPLVITKEDCDTALSIMKAGIEKLIA